MIVVAIMAGPRDEELLAKSGVVSLLTLKSLIEDLMVVRGKIKNVVGNLVCNGKPKRLLSKNVKRERNRHGLLDGH